MNRAISKITFNYLVEPFYFPHRTKLKTSIVALFKQESQPLAALDYIFCSDDYLLAINNDFLHHDYFTDIVTFNLTEKTEGGIRGEIYISIDRVKDNSRQLQQSFTSELRRVVFHGALHLCGYRDKSKKEIAVMRAREDFYLSMV